jgi:hypothetical protein
VKDLEVAVGEKNSENSKLQEALRSKQEELRSKNEALQELEERLRQANEKLGQALAEAQGLGEENQRLELRLDVRNDIIHKVRQLLESDNA